MMGSQAQMPRWIFVLICVLFCIFRPCNASDPLKTSIIDVRADDDVLFECENATFICEVAPAESQIWWSFDGRPLGSDPRYALFNITSIASVWSHLNILCVTVKDSGNYSCHASDLDFAENVTKDLFLLVKVPVRVVKSHGERAEVGSSVTLSCKFEGYPLGRVDWLKGRNLTIAKLITSDSEALYDDVTKLESKLQLRDISSQHNGTYYCRMFTEDGEVYASVPLIVLDKPKTNFDFVKAIGATRVYLNWTVNDGNSPVKSYFILYKELGTNDWIYFYEAIGGGNTSYIIDYLIPNTYYNFALTGHNDVGSSSKVQSELVKTMVRDPDFVPDIKVLGVSPNSIAVGWTFPPLDAQDLIHYYQLVIVYNDTKKETYVLNDVKFPTDIKLTYVFEDLLPATTYYFKVSSCSNYGKICWNWSKEVNGTTLDGAPGPPTNVSVSCKFDNISRSSFIYATWEPPIKMNGKIKHYNVILEGDAIYKNERGTMEKKSWRHEPKYIDEKDRSARFDMIPANTNYSIKVSGVTRSGSTGPDIKVKCGMPPTIPDKDKLNRFTWVKMEVEGKWLFKLFLPRVSERNGPICCYRVILIKLEPQQTIADLSVPEDIEITTYEDVHNNKRGGAYVAEMFESNMLSSEVFLGDGITSNVETNQCRECFAPQPSSSVSPEDALTTHPPSIFFPDISNDHFTTTTTTTTTQKPTTTAPTTTSHVPKTTQPVPASTPYPGATTNVHSTTERLLVTTMKMEEITIKEEIVHNSSEDDVSSTPTTTFITETRPYLVQVHDGKLDMSSNYTGFVEITVFGPKRNTAYSGYFTPLNPGPQEVMAEPPQVISTLHE